MVEAINHLEVRSCLIKRRVVYYDEKHGCLRVPPPSEPASPSSSTPSTARAHDQDLRRRADRVRKATLASVSKPAECCLNQRLEHFRGNLMFPAPPTDRLETFRNGQNRSGSESLTGLAEVHEFGSTGGDA